MHVSVAYVVNLDDGRSLIWSQMGPGFYSTTVIR